jgi:hypothetical protein
VENLLQKANQVLKEDLNLSSSNNKKLEEIDALINDLEMLNVEIYNLRL